MTDPASRIGSVSSGIDPRGLRTAAVITSVVLAVTLVTGSVRLLAVQALVFAIGSLFGVRHSPYGWFYRRFVRRRLGPPTELEDPAPPRFAQSVGLAVTGSGLVLALLGVRLAVEVSAGLAFVAAFLNATIDFCLGCRLYVLLATARPSGSAGSSGGGARPDHRPHRPPDSADEPPPL